MPTQNSLVTQNSVTRNTESRRQQLRLAAAIVFSLICHLSSQNIRAENLNAPDAVKGDVPALKFSCAVLSQTNWQSPEDVPWEFHYTPAAHLGFDFVYSLSEMQDLDSRKKPFVEKVVQVDPKTLCYISGEELEAQNALLEDAIAKGDKQKAIEIANSCPRRLSDLEPDIKTIELKTAIDVTIGQPLAVTSIRMIRKDNKVQHSAYETTHDLGAVPEISYTKLVPHFGKNFFAAPESHGQDFYMSMSFSCKVFMSQALDSSAAQKAEPQEPSSSSGPTPPNDETKEKYKNNPYYNPKLPIWSA